MTLTFKRGLDNFKANQQAGCLRQRAFNSNVIVRTQTYTHRHTSNRLFLPDHWSDRQFLETFQSEKFLC